MEQRLWKEAVVGERIPERTFYATTQTLVKFAGASGDFHPLHYDWDYARGKGYSTPMVHGQLSRAWMVESVSDWIKNPALIERLSCRFVSSIFPVGMSSMTEAVRKEATCIASGEVTAIYTENGRKYMECSLWVKTPQGANVVTGSAKIRIPEEQ